MAVQANSWFGFDITGKGVANPIWAFWTRALLREHLGEKEAVTRLMSAIESFTLDKAALKDVATASATITSNCQAPTALFALIGSA